jgi:hypothetical protein
VDLCSNFTAGAIRKCEKILIISGLNNFNRRRCFPRAESGKTAMVEIALHHSPLIQPGGKKSS